MMSLVNDTGTVTLTITGAESEPPAPVPLPSPPGVGVGGGVGRIPIPPIVPPIVKHAARLKSGEVTSHTDGVPPPLDDVAHSIGSYNGELGSQTENGSMSVILLGSTYS